MKEKEQQDIFEFIKNEGRTPALVRTLNWNDTSLGAPDLWPAELLSYINILLSTPSPMCLIWGPERIQLFNDDYLDLFASQLPESCFGSSLNKMPTEMSLWMDPLINNGYKGRAGKVNDIKPAAAGCKNQHIFSFAYSPLYLDSRVQGVLLTLTASSAVVEDQKKLNEDRALFQILSDASPILTATCNPDGTADYFSTSWMNLTGWKKEQLLGYGWVEIIHPEDSKSFLEVYKEAVQQKKDWRGTFRIRSTDGNYHLLAAAGTPLYNENNLFLGYISSSVDITKQHRLISSLEQSQQQLTAMIQRAPIGICLLDARTLVSEVVNDSFLEVAGKPYEAVAGQYYWDSFAEARPYYEDALAGVVKKGETYFANEVELMLIRHGREETVYVTFVYTPLKDLNGGVEKVAVWVLENTLQVQSREKVAQSERETRALIESAPFPIGVYKGKEMRVALANNAIIKVWGKGPDVIGKLFSEILPELDNQEVFQQLDTVFATGESFHITNQRLDLIVDGQRRPYYFNYSLTPLFDSDGLVYGVMNTGADVTELNLAQRKIEENERNLRSTILQAPVAMCIFRGPQYIVEIANSRMLDFWGKTQQQVQDKPIFEGLPEAREQGFEDLLYSVYTTGKPVSAEAVPVTLPRSGQVENVYVNFVYEAFREPDQSISGILAVAVDVTAQILAHQKIEETVEKRTRELADSNENLQRTNSELAQFAYIASHDLQEPLRKISVFSQMLENTASEALSGRAADYLAKIKTSAGRMTALVRDVLAYSELGKKEDAFQRLDLGKTIQAIVSDYELLIEQKKADIIVKGLPVIEAIPLQMTQLFANLISNALKYVDPDKNPIITVSASNASMEEIFRAGLHTGIDYVKIQVSDNGIGIAPEHVDQIFSIFKRLHRKSEFEGTGIGLAICRKIAQNHRGEINAQDSSNSGAVFNIYLPSAQPN